MVKAAKGALGTRRFGWFFLGDAVKLRDRMTAAHERAVEALRSGPGSFPVRVSIALQDEQAVGPDSRRDCKCAEVYDHWLEAAGRGDFLGVQTYTRCRVGKKSDLGPGPGSNSRRWVMNSGPRRSRHACGMPMPALRFRFT